jgi:hypothetical protein
MLSTGSAVHVPAPTVRHPARPQWHCHWASNCGSVPSCTCNYQKVGAKNDADGIEGQSKAAIVVFATQQEVGDGCPSFSFIRDGARAGEVDGERPYTPAAGPAHRDKSRPTTVILFAPIVRPAWRYGKRLRPSIFPTQSASKVVHRLYAINQPSKLRSFNISCAALCPGAPVTPPPG